jgi:hypothetical protein
MSSWRYFISVERRAIGRGGGGGGKVWWTYVEDGDISSLHHRII